MAVTTIVGDMVVHVEEKTHSPDFTNVSTQQGTAVTTVDSARQLSYVVLGDRLSKHIVLRTIKPSFVISVSTHFGVT